MKNKNTVKEKEENLIHIRLDYSELVQSKRDLLALEMSLLRILKSVKTFHSLRGNELDKKQKISGKIKEAKISINKIQTTLPKIKVPEILEPKYSREEQEETLISKPQERKYDASLEEQLQDIQRKLSALSQ